MGNSIMRHNVFSKSWWIAIFRRGSKNIKTEDCCPDKKNFETGDCRRDRENIEAVIQPQKEQSEHRAVEKENPNGLSMTVVDGGRDDAFGNQLVGNYYTKWYNVPEDVWQYYSKNAVYTLVDFDGKRYVAMGQKEIRDLFDKVAAPETVNHENDDGDCRTLVVKSIVTVRGPWFNQLLIMATTDMFTQSFLVESSADGSFAIISSVVLVKRDDANPQTPQTSISRRRRRRCRRGKNAVEATVAEPQTP